MAAINSPRRILGDRDVNKTLLATHSSSTVSPGKLSIPSHRHVTCENGSGLAHLAKVLLSPKIEAGITSSSTSRKRAASCMEDLSDGSPRKQVVIGVPDEVDDVVKWKIVGLIPHQGREGRACEGIENAAAEAGELRNCTLRRSVSPDSLFDTTQDSELNDSQNTTMTEPDLAPPLPFLAPLSMQAPAMRLITQEEARENAKALCLRLRMAMYKIKTNQTDLPLAQLQIHPPTSQNPLVAHSSRKPLPTSRPAPADGRQEIPTSHQTSIKMQMDSCA